MLQNDDMRARIIDLVVASILILASVLKAASPRDAAVLLMVYGVPIWATFVLLLVEAGVGVCFLLRIGGHWRHLFGSGLFFAFFLFSAHRALGGYDTCGCFGSVPIPPWITASLDVTLAILLARSARQSDHRPFNQGAFVAAMLAVIGCITALWQFSYPRPLADAAIGEMVVIEPEAWIGSAAPIRNYFAPPVDIHEGNWDVLLYHHGCASCRKVIEEYQMHPAEHGVTRLLVEVPPYGSPANLPDARFTRLINSIDWFVAAPIEVQVRVGVVANVISRETLLERGGEDTRRSSEE